MMINQRLSTYVLFNLQLDNYRILHSSMLVMPARPMMQNCFTISLAITWTRIDHDALATRQSWYIAWKCTMKTLIYMEMTVYVALGCR